MNIQEFCDHHLACADGRDWALANCADMQDAWCKLKPGWLIWVATRQGVLTDKELRLFAVFCVRQVEHLLTDQRSKEQGVRVMILQIACLTLDRRVCANRATLDHCGVFCKIAPRTLVKKRPGHFPTNSL